MTEPIRWGVMGTGGIAHTFARDLELIDDGVIVAVGSRTHESAQAFGAHFDVPHRHGSYEELAADSEVDVIYVATPHPMHYGNALLALEYDKPALVE
ncbi:MAG: Gfo/Idh/MocA family oxidoreductase, partial [Acidimicrobiales bacterium]